MTFHLMFDNIDFSLVWVSEWPSFGKKLLNRLTICSLSILTLLVFSLFPVSALMA